MKYKISQFARKNNVTIRTVWNWIKYEKVQTERTKTGGWLIIEDEEKIKSKVFVYCRISSSKDNSNLELQKQRLLNYCSAKGYIVEDIITEIGSGLNDNRPKLEKILIDKSITKIVVEHKDRLVRFGLNYIEKLLKLDNREIEFINPPLNEKDDLLEDFKLIISSFHEKLYNKKISNNQLENLINILNNKF
jgi:putative resolvase